MTGHMDAVDVICTKRDGERLSDEQIDWFIDAYTAGEIADEQASALLMAIVWRGMEPDELATLLPEPPDPERRLAAQRRLEQVGITWPGSPS